MNDDIDACSAANCPCVPECPLGAALSVIGGRWKLRLLCSLKVDGAMRYNDLERRVSGISPAMLSSSLKELERDGLITRAQYGGIPVRVEYSLTEKGGALWPILHELAHWALGVPVDET